MLSRPVAALPAVLEVLRVADAHLLGLVAREADRAANLGARGPLVAAFAQQAVDRLDLVPA